MGDYPRNSESLVGKTIRGKKIIMALDLKFGGKLKPDQQPPQLLYTE
jgi:hypothetical protein